MIITIGEIFIMKKRFLALLFIFCPVLSACGSGSQTPETTTKPAETTTKETTVETTTEAVTETTTEAVTETTTEQAAEVEDAKLANIMGVKDGQTYRQDLFKVKADLGDNFYIATDAELNQMQANVEELIDTGSTAYDLYAIDQQMADTITITLFSISYAEMLSLKGAPGTYYDVLIPQLDKQYNDLAESAHLSDIHVDKGTVSFLGKDVPCVHVAWMEEDYNVVHYQTQILLGAFNNAKPYGLCITTASYQSADAADQLLDVFEANG